MIQHLSYASGHFGRVINIDYDDVLHEVVASAITGIPITPPGVYSYVEIYRQTIVGQYWSVKVKNTAPYAYVENVSTAVPCDIVITGIDVVPVKNGNLGSLTIHATGGGPLLYSINAGDPNPQASNVFNNLAGGTYLVTVSRVFGCLASQSVVVPIIPDLVIQLTATDATAAGSDDGKLVTLISQGSGKYHLEYSTGDEFDFDGDEEATNTLLPLEPGEYWAKVTDTVSGQERTVYATIAEPSPEPVHGSIFDVPLMNSIRYVPQDGLNTEQGLDNVLLCQLVYGMMDQTIYYQKYNKGDKPKTQFNSNFTSHAHELRNYLTGALVASFSTVKVEDNLNKVSSYTIQLAADDPGQTRVYFDTSEIPLPLSVGDAFQIADNVAFNGTYAVIGIRLDEDANSQYLVITKAFGAPGSTLATALFIGTSATFDVFESTVDLTNIANGIYYLVLTASLEGSQTAMTAISEPIEIKERHDNVLLVVYNNYDNAFGMTWTTGYTGFIRVEGLFGHKRPTGGERSTSRDADYSITKISARKTRNILLELFTIPPYLAEKLSIVFDCDVFAINNVACQSTEGLQINTIDGSILTDCNILIEQLNWFNKYNSNDNLMSSVSETADCACDEIDLTPVGTSTPTVTLDFLGKRQRIFKLQPSFATNKTIAMANNALALAFKLKFEVTQAFIDDAQYIQFPATFKSNAAPLWDSGTKRFTPADAGLYEAEATYDGTNWQIIFEQYTFN